jgi:hypothetical protein
MFSGDKMLCIVEAHVQNAPVEAKQGDGRRLPAAVVIMIRLG